MRRAGYTLLELTISVALMAVLLGAFARTLDGMRRLRRTNEASARLSEMGVEALDAILDDLSRAGFVQVAGNDFPYLFDDGSADPPFDAHDHAPAIQLAKARESDFGPNREIVLVLPADADADGVPDVDASGALVFGTDEISWVVNTGPDGVNRLERRTNAVAPRRIASGVERVAFDDAASSLGQVPIGAVRVRLWFRWADDGGTVHRHHVEATVRTRNGTGV